MLNYGTKVRKISYTADKSTRILFITADKYTFLMYFTADKHSLQGIVTANNDTRVEGEVERIIKEIEWK